MQTHSKFEITSGLQNFDNFASKLVLSYQVCIYLILLSEQTSFHFSINRQFYFLELQLINFREATVLLSFVFKDSQQQPCLLRNMIIECQVRSDLSLQGARANQIAISSVCRLFHFSARYFNKNNKTINQSDLRNNAQHVIKQHNGTQKASKILN